MSIGTQRKLGQADHGRLVSAQAFADAEFDERWRYERDDGRLVVMAPEGYEHQVTAEPWRDRLVAYKIARPNVVRHVFSHPWVRPDPKNDRIGGSGVFLTTSILTPNEQPIPDIVFEIVSPGKAPRERDDVKERSEYEAIGIREYVIIDRFDLQVVAFSLTPTGYSERILTTTDAYTSPLLPGFALPLSQVL
jgi:Uma2 family endonuclease